MLLAQLGCSDSGKTSAPTPADVSPTSTKDASDAGSKAALRAVAAGSAKGSRAAPSAAGGTLLFAGDLALSLRIGQRLALDAKALGEGYPLAAVAARVRQADWAIGNLECVASVRGTQTTAHNPFRCAPQALEALRNAGFDALSVANNHAKDFGDDGFLDMLRNIRAAKLTALGEGAFGKQPQQPLLRELGGTKVALFGYYYPPPDPGRDVRAWRSRADVIIVFNHWGFEGVAEPLVGQRLVGRQQLKAGADLVVGTHAHVRQPSEWVGGKLIVYGLGNAVFSGMSNRADQLNGAFLEVDVAAGKIAALRLLPIRLNDAGEPTFVTPPEQLTALTPAAAETAATGADSPSAVLCERSPYQRLLNAPAYNPAAAPPAPAFGTASPPR